LRRNATAWFSSARFISGVFCLWALDGLLRLTPARAESHLVATDYISRPLVLPKGVLRIDGGPRRPYPGGQIMPAGQLQVFVNKGQDVALLSPGAAFGVIDDLELGAVWPLVLSPDLDLLDLSVYGKYQLQRGSVEVAAYGELRIPVQNDLEVAGGVPVNLHLSPDFRVETGGFLRLVFSEDINFLIDVPISVPIQVSPQVFVGPELGIEISDFDYVAVPLGVLAGYTLGSGLGSIGDLFGRLTITDIAHGANTVRFDIGAELFFDL
jgi:hypothetical protein